MEEGGRQSICLFASVGYPRRSANFQPRFTIGPNARANSSKIVAEPGGVPKAPLGTGDRPPELFGPADVPVRVRVCRVAKLAQGPPHIVGSKLLHLGFSSASGRQTDGSGAVTHPFFLGSWSAGNFSVTVDVWLLAVESVELRMAVVFGLRARGTVEEGQGNGARFQLRV
jgi:hypothetical protein